ncbi:MAG: phosphoribosylaminoimidazolesuccinocarboxamide synthase [Candidatus Kapaibacterium sp.]
MRTIYSTDIKSLKLLNKGKVRDIYESGSNLLIVATDRISAFDVIMNQPVPGKGIILTKISEFWFNKLSGIIPNHQITTDLNKFPAECKPYADELEGRSMLVKKCRPLPVEFVVRGYITGSGWKEYKKNGTVCGIKLPAGLKEFERLPEPVFTPATKAAEGHDENIGYEQYAEIIGEPLATKLKDKTIELYKFGADYLKERGIILADTKFEFGLDEAGAPLLIDEALTPDSSRFWLKENYAPGKPQYNFDKQVLRDYLETIEWNKKPPAPELPDEVIHFTYTKYKEALDRIIK